MLGKTLVENFVGDKKRSIKCEKIKMSVSVYSRIAFLPQSCFFACSCNSLNADRLLGMSCNS